MAINGLPIIVAAVVNMIIGMFWYSPFLFGNIWLKLTEKKPEELREVSRVYSFSIITSLITASILDFFILIAQAGTIFDGIRIGVLIWLGFVATSTLAPYLFEGRPMKLYLLYIAYQLIAFVTMSAILTVWI